MAWVPIQTSSLHYTFADNGSGQTYMSDSVVYGQAGNGRASWLIDTMDAYGANPIKFRITNLEFNLGGNSLSSFVWYDNEGGEHVVDNEDPTGNSFLPSVLEADVGMEQAIYFYGPNQEIWENSYQFLVEVWLEDGPPPPPSGGRFKVYELDKGWSFDGAYIPHFLEMNWYFGDDPFTDKTIQKVRIHGLSKGLAQLQLSVAGMQHDYDGDFTEPQFINIPRNAAHISEEYIPVTNYVDSSNWGVSHQLRFEGSNTDLSKPEPSHVLQVLALQGSPQDNGKRIN